MAIEHSGIEDPDIHEPKGASTATSNQVYVADGAGSGDWSDIQYIIPILLTYQIDDVTTTADHYVPIPYGGTIERIVTVIDGALTTADCTVQAEDSSTNVMGTITITQSGSAAGDVDSVEPASNNSVVQDDYIKLAVTGGGGTARSCSVTVALLRG